MMCSGIWLQSLRNFNGKLKGKVRLEKDYMNVTKDDHTRIPVGVLGATGAVGQRFVQLLEGHPWFEVVSISGSDRTAGMRYGEGCHWVLPEPMPERLRDAKINKSIPDEMGVKLVFSALPGKKALNLEPEFARAGVAVCSNASAFRPEPDVPILLPEVNPGHINIIPAQRTKRGWSGCIVTNSNCTSTGMTIVLKALEDAFGIGRVFAVSLQALSGAGYPGVASLDILDNVIPYVPGEEEKVEWEPRKMLGKVVSQEIEPADFIMSVHTNRVPVSDGHLVCLSLELEDKADENAVIAALERYQAPPASKNLPSTPKPVILYRKESDRPQPRLDRMAGKGMTTVVGRVRPDPLFDYKLVVLSHNTIRGAAGGSIYNAELLVDCGYIG
jgi:aspartate-semialdehyde dehydrogenase